MLFLGWFVCRSRNSARVVWLEKVSGCVHVHLFVSGGRVCVEDNALYALL